MHNKVNPVIVTVIIVVCVLLTCGLGIFLKAFVVNSIEPPTPSYDTKPEDNNYENKPEDNIKDDDIKDDDIKDDYIKDTDKDKDKNKDNISTDKDEEKDNVNTDKTEKYKPFTMKCSKETERGLEENYFYFTWKESDYEDGYYINRFVTKLTVPEEYNVNDYYLIEENSNGGRYYMRLEGRTIISEIDSSHPFWKSSDFKYKNMLYRYINKQFVEDDYTCESNN